MSRSVSISSERELVRLLQVGIVLEEVLEARASHHARVLTPTDGGTIDPAVEAVLAEARDEAADHRARLDTLVDELEADTVPFERVEHLVRDHYHRTRPDGLDDIVYEQFHAEESAYKFYDDLIAAIEDSTVGFTVDQDVLLETIEEIRQDEAEGAREIMALIERNL